MQSLNDDERKLVLGEVLADELKVIHEYVMEIPGINKRLISVKKDVKELKADMQIVKAIVKDHSRQLNALTAS